MNDTTNSNHQPKGFIIPALDIIDGKCVRLTKGDFEQQKIYSEDPVEVAKRFEAAGFQRLHVVDLDGAQAGKLMNLKLLESIAAQTSLVIDYGGGVKQISDVESIFNAGAAIVTLGSLAVKHPELLEEWLMEFGSSKFLIGADVLDERIRIHGWQEDAGMDIYSFIGKMIGLGVTNIFCTDISKDGMLQGVANKLYAAILAQHPELCLIASGGVSNIEDIALLKEAGCSGAIVGKAIYEGRISLEALQEINTRFSENGNN